MISLSANDRWSVSAGKYSEILRMYLESEEPDSRFINAVRSVRASITLTSGITKSGKSSTVVPGSSKYGWSMKCQGDYQSPQVSLISSAKVAHSVKG